jgi:hypothetical protein
MLKLTWPALTMVLLLPGAVMAQGDAGQVAWTSYIDPTYGFSVELPLGLFEPLEEVSDDPGMTLVEPGGSGQLSIYGGAAQGLTLDEFAQRLSSGEQVRTITYRAGGQSWFVLSGDYTPDSPSDEALIFYTKVLLSPDGNSFSAFELSYPKDDKARYDAIVERIEDSMTRPGAAG